MSSTRYVCLLRGINVGGKMLKMAELRAMFERMGFTDVKTLLNSGNALFSSDQADRNRLIQTIEKEIETTFRFHVDVLLVRKSAVHSLVDADPFGAVSITKETKLYVTFISDETITQHHISYETPENDYRILSVDQGIVVSILDTPVYRGTVDVMAILEKRFGKRITTRTWNTVRRIVAA